MPMIHEIKLDITYCDDVFNGRKSFELRLNDRDYKVGDLLHFQPIGNGQAVTHPISKHLFLLKYILSDERFLQRGYVAMSILMLEEQS